MPQPEIETVLDTLLLPVCVTGKVVATAVLDNVAVAHCVGVVLGLVVSVAAFDEATGVPDPVTLAEMEPETLKLMVGEEV